MLVSEDTIDVTITYEEAAAITAIIGGLKVTGMMEDFPKDLQKAIFTFTLTLHEAISEKADEVEGRDD